MGNMSYRFDLHKHSKPLLAIDMARLPGILIDVQGYPPARNASIPVVLVLTSQVTQASHLPCCPVSAPTVHG
jgi:hypothetical protein